MEIFFVFQRSLVRNTGSSAKRRTTWWNGKVTSIPVCAFLFTVCTANIASRLRTWETLDERSFPGADGTFIHPFDDDNFIAGHGTMGLEILEDAPETAAVIASIGGGGLITGVGAAIKALKLETKIFGVEPETAAPSALSFKMGSPQVFKDWKASFVDGAGGQSTFPRMRPGK